MKTIQICGVMSAVLLLACKEAEPGAGELKSAELSPVFRQVFETIPRGEAQEIHRLRTTAKEGDEVTVQGRIMGVESPFVDGRAICILGDPKILTPCNEIPGDSCETPWDVCCDSAEDKKNRHRDPSDCRCRGACSQARARGRARDGETWLGESQWQSRGRFICGALGDSCHGDSGGAADGRVRRGGATHLAPLVSHMLWFSGLEVFGGAPIPCASASGPRAPRECRVLGARPGSGSRCRTRNFAP
jgi:hypothetical protein